MKLQTFHLRIMEKYTVPNIPTTEQVLEDIFDVEIVQQQDHPIKVTEGNEILLNAHSCYKNFKQLQEDVMKQDGLNSKLDELNHKLVENIANMKKQT